MQLATSTATYMAGKQAGFLNQSWPFSGLAGAKQRFFASFGDLPLVL